jgi:glycogen phosphorylase
VRVNQLLACRIRDRLIEAWNDTNAYFDRHDPKRVAYMSLEYLMGRAMQNALLNLDLEDNYREALDGLGFDLERLYEEEPDAALGNGGLGRLAACFLDSLAALDMPAWGYGLRYNFGIFKQRIKDGEQIEVPDYWLTFGNPWEIERVDVVYPVRFYGEVVTERNPSSGMERKRWRGGEVVMAVAYDNPVPGFDTFNTINLRLWRAAPSSEFDLASFNSGDYVRAVEARQRAETISHILYPADNHQQGKELRLKQQYLFVSATLQDVLRRFLKVPHRRWSDLPKKLAVQLNDTHPALAIADLMRILVDDHSVPWDEAWDVTRGVFGYTNHTLLPEALEKWPVELLARLLPRHLEIIYLINWFWMRQVAEAYSHDISMMEKMSIIEESPVKQVRMAHLAVIGSHAVNGVAAIHTHLLRTEVFPYFDKHFPGKFQNKTNGVTPRRWINQCNPKLADCISRWLETHSGDGFRSNWLKDLSQLEALRGLADDPALQLEWQDIKLHNKRRLADLIEKELKVRVDEHAIFDVQIKRIHEYKRQLLNVLWCVHRYHSLKAMSRAERSREAPRVVMFAGKAAPGYYIAKRIIKLVHCVGDVVNNDPEIDGLLKVLFLPNYNVSLAEIIIPAADLSQQISCAGMEASGTGNMKQAMNGALIIGTLDGANVEIGEECGFENLFIFGARASEVSGLRAAVHKVESDEVGDKEEPVVSASATPGAGVRTPAPEGDLVGADALTAAEMAEGFAAFDAVVAAIAGGDFNPLGGGDHSDLLRTLDPVHDYYLVRQDFPSYCLAQARVQSIFLDKPTWTRMSIMTSAGCGKFSSDRTIQQYCSEMWGIKPLRRPDPMMASKTVMQDIDAIAEGVVSLDRLGIDPMVDESMSPTEREMVAKSIAKNLSHKKKH